VEITNIQQGDIFLARLNPNQGQEVGKIRPVILYTATPLIPRLSIVTIIPLTSQFRPNLTAFRIPITKRDRLLIPSYAMIEHIRSIDKQRINFNQRLTRLSPLENYQIQQQLKVFLNLTPFD